MDIQKIINYIYYGVIWINKNIFEPLNVDTRINAFIGVIGVLVAIVIFVAQTMDSNKYETQKRFILYKTKIKEYTIFSISILAFCILKQLLPYEEGCDCWIEISFFIVELLLNISILKSIYLTIKLFVISINLNTNSDYFFNEFNIYIESRLKAIHMKNIENSTKKLKNESLEKLIKENKKYLSIDLDNKDNYIPVKASRSGIFKCYSCRTLQGIIDKIEEGFTEDKEYKPVYEPLIILPLKGGEKVNRGVTIAYCNKKISGFEESIKNSILYHDSIPYQDNEINLIINDLYLIASRDIKNDFDDDNRLFELYNFLYKNNMQTLLNISFEYIRKVFIEYHGDLNANKELTKFLSRLSYLTYSNEDYEHYKFISDYLYYFFREQLSISDDIRQVTYDFTNTVIRYDYYSVKKNKDSIYYDVLISNLLKFMFDLIESKQFDAINDLFNNVIFDSNSYIDDEPDDYDIVRMQFSFGFIYGLIILTNKNIFDESDNNTIKLLIENIKRNFVSVYEISDIIYYFKKYYHKYSNVQNVYNEFNFRFEDKKYKNSWSGMHIEEIFVLKEFIYLFDIDFFELNNIKEELKLKYNKYFYTRFIEIIKSDNEYSDLDKLLKIKYNNQSLKIILEKLVDFSKQDEEKFIKENKLNKDKTNQFRTMIFKEIEKGNELINYLKKNKKIKQSKKKKQTMFGFNQIIGRDLFFDDVYGIENISRDYGKAITSGISKKYIKKLDSFSVVSDEKFNEKVEKINNIEDYVIITSPLNWKILDTYDYNNKTVKINDKELSVIIVPKAKDIYLIEINKLPIIDMFDFDKENDDDIVKNGIFYQLIDCSANEKARKEIQKNTKWLSEKGNMIEQMEYLKGKCALKLLVSPSIRKIKNSECIKFIVDEDDK